MLNETDVFNILWHMSYHAGQKLGLNKDKSTNRFSASDDIFLLVLMKSIFFRKCIGNKDLDGH